MAKHMTPHMHMRIMFPIRLLLSTRVFMAGSSLS
jgi:hypothetical protein